MHTIAHGTQGARLFDVRVSPHIRNAHVSITAKREQVAAVARQCLVESGNMGESNHAEPASPVVGRSPAGFAHRQPKRSSSVPS